MGFDPVEPRLTVAAISMTAYILRRLLATIPVMVVVAVFVFFLLRLAPGDPAAIIAGEDATAEQIAAVRGKLGLDRPIFEQFVVWVVGMLQGDFGTSIFSNLPVSRLILQRLEPTVSLTLATLVVAVCLAIPLGVLAAWKARRLVDRLVMGFAVMGFAMPVFLVGYVLDLSCSRSSSAGCPCKATGRWPRDCGRGRRA